MNVRELKGRLSGMGDNLEVRVVDTDEKGISIVGVSYTDSGVLLLVNHEFPDSWYYENGEEKLTGYTLRPDEVIYDDIEFCDEKLFGGCVTVHLRIQDGYAEGHGIRVEYPKLADLTFEQVMELDEYLGGRIKDSGVVFPDDVILKYGKVVSFDGLMSTSNGHNAELVKKINVLWVERKDDFGPILKALYERDLEEIYHADSFSGEPWNNYDEAYADLSCYPGKYVRNYLMHVADDGDLETIFNFLT